MIDSAKIEHRKVPFSNDFMPFAIADIPGVGHDSRSIAQVIAEGHQAVDNLQS
jgi:hypothetical protein